MLKEAVTKKLLTVHGPWEKAPRESPIVRDFYEEVYWDDLNNWMDKALPRLKWRFPGDDDLNEPTLSAIVGAEPDYREFCEYEPLERAICYALGVPPALIQTKETYFLITEKKTDHVCLIVPSQIFIQVV